MNEKKKLWTKDFSCITGATILSAIGGEAMNLPVSLLVFEKTQSTLLAALIMVCGMLPDVVLSVIVAPFIDKGSKKKWIVSLDILLALIYILMGFWIGGHDFSYGLYVVFTLVVATISVFYRLAYSSWYPDLIPVGLEQKGYAISSTVYPMVIIIMSPLATYLYEHMSMSDIFYLVAGISIISILIESMIHDNSKKNEETYTLHQYVTDIREGFAYLRREKGIRNIYTYMSITSGAGEGVNVITQAFYQTKPWLSVTMLGYLKSAEMIGRMMSGLFQYLQEIPVKKRFLFTKIVYTVYNVFDAILLFLPFPCMLGNRFICGALGTSSATIREAATQSYLDPVIRARVNAVFNVVMALGGILFQLLAGVMGQVMSYRLAAILLSVISLFSMYFLIFLPAKENRPVYEAIRKEM